MPFEAFSVLLFSVWQYPRDTELQEDQLHSESKPDTHQKAGSKNTQVSRNFSVAVCLLLLLAMCVFWLISSYNTRNLLQQQADELGQTLSQQTAIQLTELVLSNDLISMNVVLSSLTRDSNIAEVAILNVDNDIIAVAMGSPSAPAPLIRLPFRTIEAEYLAPISLANSFAGFVRIRLDLSYIEVGVVNNLLLVVGATLLLLIAAASLTTTYFQYLVSFPANLLAFSLSNVRKGKIEACPEPENSNEISTAIRQFNATAEFLAQNTFLDNFGTRQPTADVQNFKFEPGRQDATLLVIRLSNFHYLSSTLNEDTLVKLLNKYYFFAGKVSQLYNGSVCYCADGEIIINFGAAQPTDEQAFYAVCTAQLFLQLLGDLADIEAEHIAVKFRLAVHSGQAVSGLYSPITHDTNNLTGRTLDLAREICNDCPDNALLISEPAFVHAGAGTRIEAEPFSSAGDEEQITTYLGLAPMSDYALLLERQAIQLVTLYSD